MSIPEDCKVDHLFLLVGGNPLPNYVGAQLLARPDTTIVLVHSSGVIQQRDALVKELQAKGFARPETLEVEESNPQNILNKVTARVATCSGKIGLHYTGGTKTMATHAYRAVEQVLRTRTNPVYYSYLDARTLSLVIEGTGISGSPAFPVGLDVQVSIEELLKLHNMANLKQEMRKETIWHHVTNALAQIHAVKKDADTWRTWCQETVRRKDRPDKFINATTMKSLTTDTFPFDSVREALALELQLCSFPATFEQIAKAISFTRPFRKADDNMAKWFDGEWFEDYVYQQINEMASDCNIHDMTMTINPKVGTSEFEFDVGCVRGYQLFAFSCTTDSDKKLCKSKLLEAIIRAEQLGGSEARTALVCCYEDPIELQEEIHGLFQGEHRVRVFGRHHLLDLKQKLMDWFNEM